MKNIEAFPSLTIDEITTLYKTSAKGLTQLEAENRLKLYGKNIAQEKKTSKFQIFFRQLNNILVYVLLVAAAISLISNKLVDCFVILGLILINSCIGFFQELKAESSIEALRKLTETKCSVLRDDKALEIPSSDLALGDVILISEGSIVAADIRLFESSSLMADESTITGESLPVIKDSSAVIAKTALPYEMKNTLLSGTAVVKGFGKGFVIKTADNTYLAKIAEEKEKSPKSPLTKAVEFFSRRYALLLILLFLSIGIFGYLQGRSWMDLAYILIAELVSALPEGLPIVVTTVLVVGSIALSKKKTLIRYLPSVETLGSATVIASDKTGTITKGNLIVQKDYTENLDQLKTAACLCIDVQNSKGDPIDIAITKWVEDHESIQSKYPQIENFPFDVNLRMMASVNKIDSKDQLVVKGAYESLNEIAINKDDNKIKNQMYQMSEEGLRTIAVGMGDYSGKDIKDWKIKIIGLIGFLDPPKEHVKEAVEMAQIAGIKVIMITGDFPLTAKAIAKQVNIFKDQDLILTGNEIENLDDNMLFEKLKSTTVLARILPEHKSRIVKVLQHNKEIVAVSGDGVNDVPALRAADLGIAMGSGTEAAKSVAKMIITDSNLKVIIDAIKNGRIITGNIRKVIYYLLSSGLQEIILISLAILFSFPLPLSPLQILWINIVTDGVQDKTFPFCKSEEDVMTRKPQKPSKKFFDIRQMVNISLFGLGSGFVSFELFKYLLKSYPYDIALTITFTSVVVMQWANGIQAQKEQVPFFKNIKKSFTINPWIFLGVVAGLILQLFAVYVAKTWFSTQSIAFNLWKYPFLMFLASFFIVEIRKWIFLLIERRK